MTAKTRDGAEDARMLGRYRLAYELASGGMATVYLARAQGPQGFEKVVAVKRIHPHLAKEKDFLQMFLDEARLASRISHPSICSVFDFGEAGSAYYIAMEYIVGETVGRILRRLSTARNEPLTPREVFLICRIIAEASEGLHAAHELKGPDGQLANLVHRDISPQNLFVAYDGTVQVVDFGIARAEGRLHQTKTGAVKGKLAYMSPEQGRKLDLDRRSDVWAMGIVLWELLTARRLFRRETDVDTILSVINDEVPPPSRVREGIPPELDAIVMKALERDRDARWATARELGHALHRFLAQTSDEPVMASDVADWMAELFPEEKRKRADLVDRARSLHDDGPIQRVSDTSLDDSSSGVVVSGARDHEVEPPPTEAEGAALETTDLEEVSDLDPIPAEPSAQLTDPDADAALVAPPPILDALDEEAPAPTRSAAPLVLASAVVVGLVGGVIAGLWALADTADEGPAPVAEAAPEAEVPPDPPAPEVVAAPDPEVVVSPEPDPAEAPNPPETAPPETAPQPRLHHRAAAPAEPGFVNVATPGGWGDVYLGSRSIGRAPGRLSVPSGRRVLTIRPFGRLPARRVTVDVPPGGTTRTVVPLSE